MKRVGSAPLLTHSRALVLPLFAAQPLNLNTRAIPSLQDLQESVDRVDSSPKTNADFLKRARAIELLNNFARNLCKPLR